jgi:type I restriction enzyme S subunit
MNKPLKYIPASKLYSKITDGTHDSPKQQSFGKYLITSKHIKGRNIDFESAYLITEQDFKKINERSQVEQWDVIVSMIGEYCGFCFIERNDNIDYAVKNVGLYKTKSELEANWLYYYLTSPIGKSQLNLVKSGSSQPYLTLGGLRELPILQPKSTQDKIKITKVLSDLDSKIELNNKINAELEGMAKLIYEYWFVQFDFPFDFAQGKPADDSSDPKDVKPYKSSGGKMVWNKELKREIPEGWESGELGDLGSIIGGSTPSKVDEENFCIDGIPWITPKDLSINSGKKFITKGETDASPKGVKNTSLKILPKGTVLLSSRAPIGYMVIARNDLTTNQGFKSFVPDKKYSTPFIFYSIQNNMKKIEQNASGSTFREISGGVLKSISICLPKNEIVETFTKAVDPIFKKQDNLELENNKLSSLRDWLLPMLMNGQVRVVEENLNSEEKLRMVADERANYTTIKK